MFTKVILLSMAEAVYCFWKKNFLVTKQSSWRKVARKKFTKEKRWQKYDLVKPKQSKNIKILKGKKLHHRGSNQGRWIQSWTLYQLSYGGNGELAKKLHFQNEDFFFEKKIHLRITFSSM